MLAPSSGDFFHYGFKQRVIYILINLHSYKKSKTYALETKDSSSSEEESSDESEKGSESKESKSAEVVTKTESVSESDKVVVGNEVQPEPNSS